MFTDSLKKVPRGTDHYLARRVPQNVYSSKVQRVVSGGIIPLLPKKIYPSALFFSSLLSKSLEIPLDHKNLCLTYFRQTERSASFRSAIKWLNFSVGERPGIAL